MYNSIQYNTKYFSINSPQDAFQNRFTVVIYNIYRLITNQLLNFLIISRVLLLEILVIRISSLFTLKSSSY